MITRRRAFSLSAAWLALAGGAGAQTTRPAGKIGYLHPRLVTPDHATLVALRSAWQPLGYVEGETELLRSAEGDMRRVPGLVAEMVAQGAGVLIVVGAAALRAADRAVRQASTDQRGPTPIVAIDLESDPVREGYAASLGRPGGHVTGLFLDQPSLAGKWIDLLREASPALGRLPTTTFQSAAVRAGLMLSYGPLNDTYLPRAALMADKILRGARPADLPIERPSRYEFVINLKTAKALGLTIPQALLLLADEVIE